MDFITKTTLELSQTEKQNIIDLFNEIFEHDRTVEEFDNQFLQNYLGYSFHTMVLKDGELVGANTMVPSLYNVDGKQYKFVNSVDTMIHKKGKGIETFYDMIKESFGHCEKLGYDIVYGFPNDNSYALFKGCKFMKDVGSLYTYCLPYRIGGVKKGLGFLNWATMIFCKTWAGVSSLFASDRVVSFKIEKDAASYNPTRYKRLDGMYSIVSDDGVDFMYKIINYEGVRAAFLIDVVQKSAKNFGKAASYIMKKDGKKFDILMYVGNLPFGCNGFIRVPHKFEPKKFNFTAGFLNTDAFSKKELYKIENWDVNLSNYDLI